MQEPLRRSWIRCLLATALVGLLAPSLAGLAGADHLPDGAGHPGTLFRPAVRSPLGAVASISPIASQVGVAVLEAGGNAIDAAVAMTFAVGVTRPEMCGIGGANYLLYRAADGSAAALDFRDAAPAAITPDVFSKPFDQQPPSLYDADTGHRVIGVPGMVAGMAAALARYGTITLAEAIAPAERLAREGFPVGPAFAAWNAGPFGAPRLRLFPAAAEVYLKGGVLPYLPGDVLVQSDYAGSLRLIAEHGPDAFYRGPIAQLIAEEMERSKNGPFPNDGGLLTSQDLADYEAIWYPPLVTTYRGHDVYGVPPSTSGGLAVLEMLNILENVDLAAAGPSSADHLHYTAEAQSIVFADRNRYAGDPAYSDVPVAQLLSKEYAAARFAEIDRNQSKNYAPGNFDRQDPQDVPEDDAAGGHTTHLSVVDVAGNMVAVTCSIGLPFGSAVVAPGTGFLLSDQVGQDFSNGTHPANKPEPGKRPRSSSSPTIVVKDGRPLLGVGAANGPLIITSVAQVVVNVVDFGMALDEAVDAERIDRPNSVLGVDLENARVRAEVQAELALRGHELVPLGEYATVPPQELTLSTGIVQAVGIDPASGRRLAVSDPRFEGGALAVNQPPRAAGEADRSSADRVQPVQFRDRSSDPDGRVTRWLWDFGDGTTSDEQNPSHLYKQLGTFRVRLTVWDDYRNPFSACCSGGASDTANVATIKVKNIPPAGKFNGAAGSGANALAADVEANRVEPVRFEDASTDPDGYVASWAWDFGDGATSSAQNPEHQYAVLGTFTARVVPTDNDGDSGTEGTRTVRVVNLVPSPDFTHRRAYPNVLEPVEFKDASSDRDGEVVAWVWDFGDGHTSQEVRPWHVFLRGGWHTVTLTAEDNDGGAATRARSLYVCNPTGEYDALADPRHVRVEFQACLRLDGGDLPFVPMGLIAADAGGFPGLLWLLAGCLSVLTRRHQAGRRNERG